MFGQRQPNEYFSAFTFCQVLALQQFDGHLDGVTVSGCDQSVDEDLFGSFFVAEASSRLDEAVGGEDVLAVGYSEDFDQVDELLGCGFREGVVDGLAHFFDCFGYVPDVFGACNAIVIVI